MKTKETSICRKCGGNGKPSKGIMNFHNIQRNDAKKFETRLLDCIKCESCGHSWIPETSTRQKAMLWWNGLSREKQISLAINYRGINQTGRGVEQIWLKETQTICDESLKEFLKNNPKPNQKQFTEFSEEHFWKYFNKFKHQDKVKMYELLKSWYEVDGNIPY